MPEPDDITLLKQYAGGDESAFTTLFERHVHLVYSTALRQARNPSHAEEITQAVFILLARKAKSLSPNIVLSGWLYQAARLTTASLIKREIRRQRREQEVYMQTLTEPETSPWEEISPLLDDAMGRLADRPWFGFGWGQPMVIYEELYLPNQTPESIALLTNDYLLVGSILGAPALGCFLAYIWLSLTGRAEQNASDQCNTKNGRSPPALDSGEWNPDGLLTVYRAGIIVLVVGFWFDGGLFKMATAAPFWTLLGLLG